MSDSVRGKVQGAIMEIENRLPELTESFEPCAPEARPGNCLLDLFGDQVEFTDFTQQREAGALEARRLELDKLLLLAQISPNTVYAATDASLPLHHRLQAVAAALLFRGDDLVIQSRQVAGRVTAPDAELFGLRVAVCRSILMENCDELYVSTDSLASAQRAVDPSVHSGQGHSLAVCRALEPWL